MGRNHGLYIKWLESYVASGFVLASDGEGHFAITWQSDIRGECPDEITVWPEGPWFDSISGAVEHAMKED